MTIGQRVKAAREEAALTQRQLAERAGVRQQTIAALESGQNTMPRADTLLRLAEALGVPARGLLTGGEERR